VVNRHVAGAGLPNPSLITAAGDTLIGVASSTSGFNFAGGVNAGSNLVGVIDKNEAEVFAVLLEAGGTLSSLNGILLSGLVVNNSSGVGPATINGNFTNNGFVDGADDGITMTGVVDGTGSFSNVKFEGLFRAGASAGFVAAGNGSEVPYHQVEVFGPEHGQVLAELPTKDDLDPGGYDQLLVYGNEVGKPPKPGVTFTGTVELQLVEGFVPEAGMEFHLVVPGRFLVKGTPPFTQDKEYEVGTIARGEDPVTLLAPELPDDLLWVTPWWLGAPFEEVLAAGNSFGSLTISVVPEPGTLLMLILGGLCLLACAWRKRRW